MPETEPETGSDPEPAYLGQRLGLPESGRGSRAGWGRRIVALVIDWAVANFAAYAVVRDDQIFRPPTTAIDALPLGVFALEVLLLTAFLGATIGQRILRIGVARLDGRPVGLPRAALRTLLILLVLPPLVQDSDGRGLHDRLAGTVVLRSR
ncbi:MAG TPA: RDD family protein [Actinopolymorphaceae bacterium]